MDVFGRYFSRNVVVSLPDFPAGISLIAIIPVFNDDDIFKTLDSLSSCRRRNVRVGVVIVVNHGENCPENIKEHNRCLFRKICDYTRELAAPDLFFHLIEAFDLPAKQAGVGYARKIAMDCAALYFQEQGCPDGVIASLDADTLLQKNYFEELIWTFENTFLAGVSIAYEHPLDVADPGVREAIIKYELYLRYYCLALRYAGHPYAFQCIGSAFAVRAIDYVAQGGMNKRQAGEDFYFLQKLISTGRFADLTATKVYPSARLSERTPFGTGQAVKQIIADRGEYQTYHLEAFRALKSFFCGLDVLYEADEGRIRQYVEKQAVPLRCFLDTMDFIGMVSEINANVASAGLFRKRFFDSFNAFRVLKYLNYVHPYHYPKMDILAAAVSLLVDCKQYVPGSAEEALSLLREPLFL